MKFLIKKFLTFVACILLSFIDLIHLVINFWINEYITDQFFFFLYSQ